MTQRPYIIGMLAVWIDIAEGNIQGARNRMSNWPNLDWSVEEAMIETKQQLQRKAA